MNISKLFSIASFLQPTIEIKPEGKKIEIYTNTINESDLNQYILYESYMPIDAIAFYIGAYRPSNKVLNILVDNILKAKQEILKNIEYVVAFKNLSNVVKDSGTIGNLIKYRNNILNTIDKSNIAKKYTQIAVETVAKQLGIYGVNDNIGNDSNMIIYTDIKETFPIDNIKRKLYDIQKNDEYKSMIKRLKNIITENKNIYKALKIEKEEFYRNHVTYDTEDILKFKISLSLGGSIIEPFSLPKFIKNVEVDKKDVKIREWIYTIMRPIEDLELKISSKSFIEAKTIVKEFLKNCLTRKNNNLDEVFEARSQILQLSGNAKHGSELEDSRQETYVKNMIKIMENLKNDQWLIKYNKDIVEDYIVYLTTGNMNDRKRLLAHFN